VILQFRKVEWLDLYKDVVLTLIVGVRCLSHESAKDDFESGIDVVFLQTVTCHIMGCIAGIDVTSCQLRCGLIILVI